jgi:hypothetical protein
MSSVIEQLSAGERQVIHYLAEFGSGTFLQLGQLFRRYDGLPLGKARVRLKRLSDRQILTRQVGKTLARYGLPMQMIYRLGALGRSLHADETLTLIEPRQPCGAPNVIRQVLIGEVGLRWQEALAYGASDEYLVYYSGRRVFASSELTDEHPLQLPDALMVLWGSDWARYFFVDLDLGKRPLETYVDKLRQYVRYRHTPMWQARYPSFPELLVVGWASAPSGATETVRQESARNRISEIATLFADQEVEFSWSFTTLDQIGAEGWLDKRFSREPILSGKSAVT